ncbi:pcd6 interacting protein-related [Anaeramoeba ignava]|uniref:Pcd6 interacting protein-related n=1 Tax=Anaeramoeba ignava TaxID=1746090 RepID=A0A9Q0R7C8_ANAIG|nr:pcd6 interacting protein-related [Anaeramoeba ignava]
MLSIPFKKTQKIDLFQNLQLFINQNYNNSFENYKQDAQQIQNLRENIQNCTQISSIDSFLKYYSFLDLLTKKLPTKSSDKKALKINWIWFDAFKNKIFASTEIEFEKASILFNIGALSNSKGLLENIDSEDGMKQALQNFQFSAGIFSYIKNELLNKLPKGITNDFSLNSIEMIISLMLAQAQECIVKKAIKSEMKPTITKKLAFQTSLYYEKSIQFLKSSPINNSVEKSFTPHLEIKKLYFKAIANQYEAKFLESTQEYGKRVSRLQLANSFAKTMSNYLKNCSYLKETVERLQKIIQKETELATKENDTIYHSEIPDMNSLSEIPAQSLVTPTPFPDLNQYLDGDPFEGLVPFHVQEAIEKYNEFWNQKIDSLENQILTKNQEIESLFTQLGLPGSFLALDIANGIPEELNEKLSQCKTQGGSNAVLEFQKSNQNLRKQCQEYLTETLQVLRKEDEDDLQIRLKNGTKWSRPTSGELNAKLMKEIGQYSEGLEKASKSDSYVDKKISKNKIGLEMIDLSKEEIEQKIQEQTSKQISEKTREIGQNLKTLFENLEEIIQLRQKTMMEINMKKEQENSANFFLNFDEQSINDSIFLSRIQEIYGELIENIESQFDEQEELIENLKELNGKFLESKNEVEKSNQSENILQVFSTAISAYPGILTDLGNGKHFYTIFQNSLKILRNKVDSFVLSREMEKKELLKIIETGGEIPKSYE